MLLIYIMLNLLDLDDKFLIDHNYKREKYKNEG